MGVLHASLLGDYALPAFTPATLPGLVGWWDASQITGLSDTDPVASWPDLSGAGRDLTQATGSKRPAYRTGILNGKPAVRMDGVDDYLDYIGGADWLTGTTLTAYIVMTNRSNVGNAGMLSLWANGQEDFNPATGAQLGWMGTSATANGDYRALGGRSQFTTPYGTTPHFTTHQWDGVNNTYWKDGIGAPPVAQAGSFAVRGARIGARGASLSAYINSDYHEVILCNAAHDAVTRAAVESYLKAKWGIFTPSSIAGLAGWYDASKMTGIADGNPIASAVDYSGNGRDLAQATSAKQPTFKTNILNGYPVMRFDGVDDFLASPSFTRAQPLTVAWAVIPRNTAASWFAFDGGSAQISHIGGLPPWRLSGGLGVQASVSPAVGVTEIDAMVFDGSASKFWKNGVATGPYGIGTGGLSGGFSIGADKTGAQPMQADFAEILLYAGAVSPSELTDLTRYLGSKYGVTVP